MSASGRAPAGTQSLTPGGGSRGQTAEVGGGTHAQMVGAPALGLFTEELDR